MMILYISVSQLLLLDKSAWATPQELSQQVQKTINIPSGGVEKLVWSDDGTKIAVLLSHGIYIINVEDGRRILSILHSNEDEGRTSYGTMLEFTPDGNALIAPLHIKGMTEPIDFPQKDRHYLFTVFDIQGNDSKYVFSEEPYNTAHGGGEIAMDGNELIAQVGSTGYFYIYSEDGFSKTIRNIGPIYNKYGNGDGVLKLFYDRGRSVLLLVYIDEEVKTWDTGKNQASTSFSTFISGVNVAALDRATDDVCIGGNGVIRGSSRDDPTTLVRCWDSKTGELVRAYSGTTSGISSVTVSPDGHHIAAITGGESLPLHLLFWNAGFSEPVALHDYGQQSRVSAVAFSPNGQTLAVAIGSHIQLMMVAQ